jgi:hypothetical protein
MALITGPRPKEQTPSYLRRHRALLVESFIFSTGVAITFLCLFMAGHARRPVDNSPLVATHQTTPQ